MIKIMTGNELDKLTILYKLDAEEEEEQENRIDKFKYTQPTLFNNFLAWEIL